MSAISMRYFKLGLFVIGALIALIALVLIVGSGLFARNRITMETYFNESVQGLDVGSKVKYRGVNVGEVTRITFTHTKYEGDKSPGERAQYVLVEARIQPGLVGSRMASEVERKGAIKERIERGLRVRITPQGVTGTSYLEIDFVDPRSNPPIAIDWEPEHLYVPSAPSTVKQLVDAASEFVAELRSIDFEKLSGSLRDALTNMNAVIAGAGDQLAKLQLDRIQSETVALLAELRESNRRLSASLSRVPLERLSTDVATLVDEVRQSNRTLGRVLGDPNLAKLPEDASATLSSATATFDRVRSLLDDPDLARSIAQLGRSIGRLERILVGREGDIATTLENLRIISDNLRDTTETAKRYPSQLILGEPPMPARSARNPAP